MQLIINLLKLILKRNVVQRTERINYDYRTNHYIEGDIYGVDEIFIVPESGYYSFTAPSSSLSIEPFSVSSFKDVYYEANVGISIEAKDGSIYSVSSGKCAVSRSLGAAPSDNEYVWNTNFNYQGYLEKGQKIIVEKRSNSLVEFKCIVPQQTPVYAFSPFVKLYYE